MKKFFITTLLYFVFALTISAQNRPARVPAAPHPIEVSQPNGEKLTIRLHGDEWKHYTTTIDGYVIAKNEKGYYCYAAPDKNGNYKPTKKTAHNKENRKKCEEKWLKKHCQQRAASTN